MKRIVLLLVSLFVVFLSTGCGPSDAEKRAQRVVQAKDDALKLRQQLAQAKSGAEAENLRQQMMNVLNDASLTVESIHFTDAELQDYVKAATAAEKPAPSPPKKAKAVRHTKAKRKG
jgi:hypothetical protein